MLQLCPFAQFVLRSSVKQHIYKKRLQPKIQHVYFISWSLVDPPSPHSNCARIHSEPEWDHLPQTLLEQLFQSAPQCDRCVLTRANKPHRGRKCTLSVIQCCILRPGYTWIIPGLYNNIQQPSTLPSRHITSIQKHAVSHYNYIILMNNLCIWICILSDRLLFVIKLYFIRL